MACRPVQELVEMIYAERKRTAAVKGELRILRQEFTRVHKLALESDEDAEDARRALDDAMRLSASDLSRPKADVDAHLSGAKVDLVAL